MAKNRAGKSQDIGDPGHDDLEKPVDVAMEPVSKPCGGNVALGALQNRKQQFLLRKSSLRIESSASPRRKITGPGGVDASVEETIVPVFDPFQQNPMNQHILTTYCQNDSMLSLWQNPPSPARSPSWCLRFS